MMSHEMIQIHLSNKKSVSRQFTFVSQSKIACNATCFSARQLCGSTHHAMQDEFLNQWMIQIYLAVANQFQETE